MLSIKIKQCVRSPKRRPFQIEALYNTEILFSEILHKVQMKN